MLIQKSLYKQIPNIQKKITPNNVTMTPAIGNRYLLYVFGWISMRTTCHLGFCSVYTFNEPIFLGLPSPWLQLQEGISWTAAIQLGTWLETFLSCTSDVLHAPVILLGGACAGRGGDCLSGGCSPVNGLVKPVYHFLCIFHNATTYLD